MKPLQLDDIAALDLDLVEERGGRPMELPLDDIDEDPSQPRSEFIAETLQELADSIAARGVLQPVSVRRHRDHPGRWILNFGARRLRAARIAGRQTIPAFEDEGADSYDQVIENEQRERLKPMDLALFIQRRQALGESQAEIARRMSKSRNYVMVASALIDAPDWVLGVYREGRCRGLNALHELRKLHAEWPGRVEAWAAGRGAISRKMLQELRTTLIDRLVQAGDASLRGASVGEPVQAAVGEAGALDHSGNARGNPASPVADRGAADESVRVAALQARVLGLAVESTRFGPTPSTVKTCESPPTPESSNAHRSADIPTVDTRCRLQATVDDTTVWVVTDAAPDDGDTVFVQHVGQPTRVQVQAAKLILVGWRAD